MIDPKTVPHFTLNSGAEIPCIGIGTFKFGATHDMTHTMVRQAAEAGYRLIDTANAYVNEKAVGRAIKKSGVPRKDIFLETKL